MDKKVLSILSVLLLASSCIAADKSPFESDNPKPAGYEEPKLDFSNTWAQNGPYSLENLKGKVVVFYFYVDT